MNANGESWRSEYCRFYTFISGSKLLIGCGGRI